MKRDYFSLWGANPRMRTLTKNIARVVIKHKNAKTQVHWLPRFFCCVPALPGSHLVSKMDGSNGINKIVKMNNFLAPCWKYLTAVKASPLFRITNLEHVKAILRKASLIISSVWTPNIDKNSLPFTHLTTSYTATMFPIFSNEMKTKMKKNNSFKI